MATPNKIVDTRRLAAKGRFGDTKIRDVDGSPAHVNAWEASILDSYGKSGEEFVKEVGSGTRNPYTGMPEYHRSRASHTHTDESGNVTETTGGSTIVTGMPPWSGYNDPGTRIETGTNIFDWLPEDIGDLLGLDDDTDLDLEAIIGQAGDVMSEGFGGLKEKLEDYLGDLRTKGILRTRRDITRGGISRAAQSQLSELFGGVGSAGGKSGFAESGALANVLRKGTRGVMGEYGGTMGTSNLKYKQDVTDIRSAVKQKMNQMILEYQTATGKPYDMTDPAYQSLVEEFNTTPYGTSSEITVEGLSVGGGGAYTNPSLQSVPSWA